MTPVWIFHDPCWSFVIICMTFARYFLFLVPKIIKLSSVQLGATLLWPQRRPVSSERYRDRKKLDKNLSTFPDCQEIFGNLIKTKFRIFIIWVGNFHFTDGETISARARFSASPQGTKRVLTLLEYWVKQSTFSRPLSSYLKCTPPNIVKPPTSLLLPVPIFLH